MEKEVDERDEAIQGFETKIQLLKKLIADKESELEVNEGIIARLEKDNKRDYEEIMAELNKDRNEDQDKIRDLEYELASKQLRIKDQDREIEHMAMKMRDMSKEITLLSKERRYQPSDDD